LTCALCRHSDIDGQDVTSEDMLTLGGLDITNYFPMCVIATSRCRL